MRFIALYHLIVPHKKIFMWAFSFPGLYMCCEIFFSALSFVASFCIWSSLFVIFIWHLKNACENDFLSEKPICLCLHFMGFATTMGIVLATDFNHHHHHHSTYDKWKFSFFDNSQFDCLTRVYFKWTKNF